MSARGRALILGRKVVDVLRSGGWDVQVHVTTSESDVCEETSRVRDTFVGAVGGDGYLTTAARGCIGGQVPLVPFPGGRGNDLCRSLGIGPDPVRWAQRLAEATTEQVLKWVRPLDAMEVASPDGEHVVLGVVSLGIDATANQIANRSWFRSGPLAYAWGAIGAFMGKYSALDIQGNIDSLQPLEEGEPQLGGWLCSVSNTGWLGGGINLLPQSRTDDGVLEIVTVEGIGRLRAMPKLAKVLLVRQLDDPIVHIYEGTSVVFDEPKGLAVMADGDVVGHLPALVRALPAALDVVAPGTEEVATEQ